MGVNDNSPTRNIILRFDMRAAPHCPEKPAARYQAALDMAAWADRQQVDVIGLSEHHNTTPIPAINPRRSRLAGPMVARTQLKYRSPSDSQQLLAVYHCPDPRRLAARQYRAGLGLDLGAGRRLRHLWPSATGKGLPCDSFGVGLQRARHSGIQHRTEASHHAAGSSKAQPRQSSHAQTAQVHPSCSLAPAASGFASHW